MGNDPIKGYIFLPLDELNVEGVRYPDGIDVAPLMEECVEFDPAVRKAMVSLVCSSHQPCFSLVVANPIAHAVSIIGTRLC